MSRLAGHWRVPEGYLSQEPGDVWARGWRAARRNRWVRGGVLFGAGVLVGLCVAYLLGS